MCLEAYTFISKTCLCFILYFTVHTKTHAHTNACAGASAFFGWPFASNTVWYHTMHEGVSKFFENLFIKMQVFSE